MSSDRRRITARWRNLNKTQKRVRLSVYSIIGLFIVLGIIGLCFKQIIAGIISLFIASSAIFVINNLPKWYMNSFYNKAEQEFQKHKNDDNKDEIYLTGDQMRLLFEQGALDMGDSMPNIILEDLFNKKDKDGK